MARIVLGSCFVRYPLGGNMSWLVQYLVGLQRLGHDVCFVEKAHYADACYDPQRRIMTDDPAAGIAALQTCLSGAGLDNRWCFIDFAGNYHGLDRTQVEQAFRDADVFIDMGSHGSFAEEAAHSGLAVLIDGEPGFTQIKMVRRQEAGEPLPMYDHYYTFGRNIGTAASGAPAAGQHWRHIYNPVVTDLFPGTGATKLSRRPAFTTVMNWQSHPPIEFEGRVYGQKDQEFWKFAELPQKTRAPMELAVSGKDVPHLALRQLGWQIEDAKQLTLTVESYMRYLAMSLGEFAVCKQVFVALNTGWFSDRSAAYLASGRPVVVQETGFSEYLPCGEGLFAVKDADEAAAAIEEIQSDWRRHSRAAVSIAQEFLEAERVLAGFLEDIGV